MSKMSGGAIAAVGFDLGDTLCEYAGVPLSWEREYAAALAGVAAQCGLELSPERLRVGEQVLLRYNTRRTPRPDHQEHAAAHIFGELLAEWAAPPEQLDRCIASFFAHFRRALRAFADATSALDRLKELGVASGVLSDVPYGMPRELVLADIADTGLPIAEGLIITSTEVGHRKPHGAGFAALAARLGVPCERMLYVGNEHKDVVGANATGCPSVLLWRATDEPPRWGQAYTIRSLAELPELLRGS